MADNSGGTKGLLGNPVFAGMIALLVVLVLAFAGNYYLMGSGSSGGNAHVDLANELKVISQKIAKHAASAAQGNPTSVDELASEKAEFTSILGKIRHGDPARGIGPAPSSAGSSLSQMESLWAGMSGRVDVILQKMAALTYLKDASADMVISMSAIQQENNKVVRALLRSNTAANEIVMAQRQALLIERMSHSIDKVLERGDTQGLRDHFTRDSQTFRQVLNGLKNGDQSLVLTRVNDVEVQNSLTTIEELFGSVSTSIENVMSRSDDVVEIRNAADAVYGGSAEFLVAGDALIQALGSADAGFSFASPTIGIGLGSAILVVFIVITILVYRQSSTSISETAQANEENQAAILQLLDELADLADGDLRVQATVTESFTGAIADSINFSIDQMRGLVSKINETSGLVSSAADQTRHSVSALSEASQRQAAEIADVSEAVNEMAVSIDMVSYNAAESSSVAERSVDIASKGAVVVQNTIDGMDNIRGQIQETAKRIKRLGESSQEIGDIVALINDIADQTNILSLNAAIQASMAGDAGKGFAVVADEVQRLAERSGAAAKQISALVKTIQSDTNEAVSSMEQTTAEVVQGTRLAQDAGVALGEIEGVSKSLAEIIENISDAARQQAASAGKISNTMKSIQEITTATTDGTKETATAVGNLADMTNELRSSVSGFKLPE